MCIRQLKLAQWEQDGHRRRQLLPQRPGLQRNSRLSIRRRCNRLCGHIQGLAHHRLVNRNVPIVRRPVRRIFQALRQRLLQHIAAVVDPINEIAIIAKITGIAKIEAVARLVFVTLSTLSTPSVLSSFYGISVS
jgi:hypothetical protein